MKIATRQDRIRRIHYRIRKKIKGTAERPRLAVHLSNKNIYAQVIDDELGNTLTAVSTLDGKVGSNGSKNQDAAKKIGTVIAERALAQNIESVVYDRGGHHYDGRIKIIADAAREAGLKF